MLLSLEIGVPVVLLTGDAVLSTVSVWAED